ncbi:MAG TPA: preprotein translocase subunit SecG [Gammaproteobacteria bacterium]|jgi:preprotein translocase subunit SecG|nr:preprotein translocase subunit SecG [Gammaproteobacteria bacterium]
MFSVLLAVQVLVSIAIIALVMLQHGKGADMGAAFGSGSSGTVFGSRGSGSFFTRATGVLAAVFFINCLLIASPLVREDKTVGDSIADRLEQQATVEEQAAETDAVVEALEQQSDLPATTDMINETIRIDEDVPGGAPPQPDNSAADDLPQ